MTSVYSAADPSGFGLSEFDLIQRYFTRPAPNAILGVGDDAALLRIAEGMELAVSTDMLVSGTHFFPDTDPFLLGHKTLAVNLSDLAAMGASPRWATLALALPGADESWLRRFSEGFFVLADQYGVDLVGGDTTRGPLNLSVTIMGEVPRGQALRRSGAEAGDDIWVSGTLGKAALGLAQLQGRIALPEDARLSCLAALHQPRPRVALGLALRGIANSAIDISDGLLADLGHILECSHAGAEIQFAAIPAIAPTGIEDALFRHCVLSGGDDYELCFTASAAKRNRIEAISAELQLPLTRIGSINAGQGCTLRAADGSVMKIKEGGYDHFA
ncbi:thiamine-monophosphate kinase [mine drainage metagenome]|uniref:Thiamine-monophosphate kinase n=1 Tax=mine drainage metagenome TaxID=410659 RepID=A0A1J5SKR0_9ZZZZ